MKQFNTLLQSLKLNRKKLLPIILMAFFMSGMGGMVSKVSAQTSTLATANQLNAGGLAKGVTNQYVTQFQIAQTVILLKA